MSDCESEWKATKWVTDGQVSERRLVVVVPITLTPEAARGLSSRCSRSWSHFIGRSCSCQWPLLQETDSSALLEWLQSAFQHQHQPPPPFHPSSSGSAIAFTNSELFAHALRRVFVKLSVCREFSSCSCDLKRRTQREYREEGKWCWKCQFTQVV